MSTLQEFWSAEVLNASGMARNRLAAVQVWSWISKALVIRKHPSGLGLSMQLFDLFEDREIGSVAAHAIGEIVENDITLSKDNFAIIKVYCNQS